MSNIESKGIDRFCIIATGDKHASLNKNIDESPVNIYLRDSESACDVRGYIELVQAVEQMCFRMPADNWALAHFALNGGMLVTAEMGSEPIAAQYVASDCWEGKMGIRFWTTVVHPELRRVGIASCLTAISTHATKSWAEFGNTICDTDSSLMGRNIRLQPLIVTANMHHTPGRKKVQLEWKRPEDPFTQLLDAPLNSQLDPNLPIVESLTEFDLSRLPERFGTHAHSQVWEDIALNPQIYRRYFDLIDWFSAQKLAVLQTPQNHNQ